MRRLACILLAFCLLWVMPGWAEETEPNLKYYESAYGFSFLYDADQFWLFDQFPSETDEKTDAALGIFSEDWFQLPTPAAALLPKALYRESAADETNDLPYVPLNEDIQAGLIIMQPSAPESPQPPVMEEEAREETALDISVPYWYQANQGMADELCIFLQNASFLIVLDYPDDQPVWKEKLLEVLSTLEFPPQPVVTEDFLLDYFQGGAVGMQFIDVIHDADAEPITLVPYRDMKDFVLEALIWDGEACAVSEAFPLYTADPLSPGDNLNIYCYFSDVLPNLRMRYTDENGNPQCRYITQSGRDGSLLLLAEDEL